MYFFDLKNIFSLVFSALFMMEQACPVIHCDKRKFYRLRQFNPMTFENPKYEIIHSKATSTGGLLTLNYGK